MNGSTGRTRSAALGAVAGVAALLLGSRAQPASAAGEYDDADVNIVTLTGPQIAEPLQRRAPTSRS